MEHLSNRWTTYRLQKRDGILIPMDADGEYLEAEGVQFLIDELQSLLKFLDADIDYAGIIRNASHKCLTEILTTYSSFADSKELIEYEYHEDNQYNRIQSGRCVYFLKHPIHRDRIKIGQSHRLYQRMKTYWNEWDKAHKPELYAVIKTPYHKQLERLIHNHLADWNITGEWYEIERVYSFLQSCEKMNLYGVQS